MIQSKSSFDWSIFSFEVFMELKEMQTAFDAGGLVSVTVFRAPLVGGYMLSVKTKKGSEHPMTSQRDTKGHPRGFKTIDAAVSNARKIGFTTIAVELD
jgi:hypothetical protein